MAKLKNLGRGVEVVYKEADKLIAGCVAYAGMVGTVLEVEPDHYEGDLFVLVEFPKGNEDWCHFKDVKLLSKMQ